MFQQEQTTPSIVRRYAEIEGGKKMDSTTDPVRATLEFALNLVPLAGAVDEFIKGNYLEAGISLAGDATMIIGLGAAIKGAKCVYSGNKIIKIASRTTAAIDSGIVATRMTQGFHALNSPNPEDQAKAWGYFGDATLRLFGLSLQAIKMLKKPICFVAGTPVHAEYGPKSIEQVVVGDRVWAFDRVAQEWRLCHVSHTFARQSAVLTSLTFVGGGDLVGTDGHPVWVVEGERLPDRPGGDHGGDELQGATPGRWVPLGAVQLGDVVLTRSGVTRVSAVTTRVESVPVYNLTVEGLHSYAAGEAGVLAHNSPPLGAPGSCGDSTIAALAKTAPEVRTKPAVTVALKDAVPDKTVVGGAAKAAKEVKAPKNRTKKPEVEGATRKNRPPRTNGDKRLGDPKADHKFDRDPGLAEFPGDMKSRGGPKKVREVPVDEQTAVVRANATEWQQQKKLKAGGEAANPNAAMEQLGLESADVFMSKQLGVTKKTFNKSGNGNKEFDLIYEKNGKYYVVEAKAGDEAKETSRLTGELLRNGDPAYAIQGSDRYLRMTIDDMTAQGSKNVALGQALDAAWKQGNLVYLKVHTKLISLSDAAVDLSQEITRYKVRS